MYKAPFFVHEDLVTVSVFNLECENSFSLSPPGIHSRLIIKQRGDESPHSKKGFFFHTHFVGSLFSGVFLNIHFVCHCSATTAGRHRLLFVFLRTHFVYGSVLKISWYIFCHVIARRALQLSCDADAAIPTVRTVGPHVYYHHLSPGKYLLLNSG